METRICPPTEENLRLAGEILRAGGLVGMPTETVYGLAADATNPKAALSVFAAKGRPADNPLIVHISDLSQLPGVVREVPERAKKLLSAFWPGPLTMILEKAPAIPAEVTAGLDTVAVRFPVHPVARALIDAAGRPLAAPSANLSGRPSTTTAEHVLHDLQGRIPLILDGGPCQVGLESTVVDLSRGPAVLLRPGGVTREMLEAALGEPVALGKGVMEPLPEGEKALSPGLKHRHYAPRAQVVVVLGRLSRRQLYFLRHLLSQMLGHRLLIACQQQGLAHRQPVPAVQFVQGVAPCLAQFRRQSSGHKGPALPQALQRPRAPAAQKQQPHRQGGQEQSGTPAEQSFP